MDINEIKIKLDLQLIAFKGKKQITMSLNTFGQLLSNYGYEFDLDDDTKTILYKGNNIAFRNMEDGSFVFKSLNN